MKHSIIYLLIVAALSALPTFKALAIALPDGEPLLVYYMPLTQITICIEYDEIQTAVGPFYQYSQRYLGTTDVITKAEKRYELTAATACPTAIADTTRAFILQEKNTQLQYLRFTPYNTLLAYNQPYDLSAEQPAPAIHHHRTTPAIHHHRTTPAHHNASTTSFGTDNTTLMPLLEEQMMASSTAKMAEGAAKQIFRIREARLNILAGDVEHAPADGQALKLTLAELTKRENELTALFIGTRTVIHHKHFICFTPQPTASSDNTATDLSQTIIRFSRHFGIVAADDLSGEAINLSLHAVAPSTVANDKPSQKPNASIYYNIPAQGELSITYNEQTLLTNTIAIAQWGVAVPVDLRLLNHSTHITFDPLTGNIISIQK